MKKEIHATVTLHGAIRLQRVLQTELKRTINERRSISDAQALIKKVGGTFAQTRLKELHKSALVVEDQFSSFMALYRALVGDEKAESYMLRLVYSMAVDQD